eukprot:CAMPEP_0118659946 /NCGR_PEP_ID=MMETSP0785-20121206/15392_1 /TAXON_ID=91992 /ORGANISM="Bolidomonas pacifica, Strain CCMP 1866" /LENGTH=226 /DNA_ID=CAMNT_0006553103 /DNA_START=45 /DNA_END=722 /DNA_ORIENTATION=-
MDVTQGKVYNGYGMRTSKLSITNIGQYNLEADAISKRENILREQMKASALTEIQRSKANHPSKLNLHMQKHYPETLSRLKNGALTRLRTPSELKEFTWNTPFETAKQVSNVDMAVTRRTIDESQFNYNKRAYNLGRSSNAEVDKIITGQKSVNDKQKYPLFPANASHQELLGIDGKLVGESAQVPAPVPERKLKWLGESVGWENNRGLPAEREEFKDGRIDLWPNP